MFIYDIILSMEEMNNRPKESYIRKIDTNLETPKRILGEARNQFTPIYFLLKKPFSV